MAPPSLPHPLDRLPEDEWPGLLPGPPVRLSAPEPFGRPAGAERAPRTAQTPHVPHPPQPPGGERPGRLPGPSGPDPLASGDLRRPHTFVLPAAPESVAAARASVRATLSAWHIDIDVVDSALVVLSELVTNAVTHSASERIVCRLHGTADRLRIEVEDQSRGASLPAPRHAGPDDQSGRGLLLVEALCSDWGVRETPQRSGRVVWAELSTEPADAAPITPTPTAFAARPVPHSAEGSLPDAPTALP
ncbi:ATP-binding protein [Streptomyces sp. AS58]|uniref:ATP-binding protein n=1 Tax=Streptomyces sp. AS58 TaxID=1519489 RepID=UPI0006AFA1B4|nr:ATP-binding protein [Streptomyces sp. AS58]